MTNKKWLNYSSIDLLPKLTLLWIERFFRLFIGPSRCNFTSNTFWSFFHIISNILKRKNMKTERRYDEKKYLFNNAKSILIYFYYFKIVFHKKMKENKGRKDKTLPVRERVSEWTSFTRAKKKGKLLISYFISHSRRLYFTPRLLWNFSLWKSFSEFCCTALKTTKSLEVFKISSIFRIIIFLSSHRTVWKRRFSYAFH